MLIVHADAVHTHSRQNGKVCLCESSEKQLFRRHDLPASIDLDRVSAPLDYCAPQITGPKATAKHAQAAE